jgi:hypothetical protein
MTHDRFWLYKECHLRDPQRFHHYCVSTGTAGVTTHMADVHDMEWDPTKKTVQQISKELLQHRSKRA